MACASLRCRSAEGRGGSTKRLGMQPKNWEWRDGKSSNFLGGLSLPKRWVCCGYFLIAKSVHRDRKGRPAARKRRLEMHACSAGLDWVREERGCGPRESRKEQCGTYAASRRIVCKHAGFRALYGQCTANQRDNCFSFHEEEALWIQIRKKTYTYHSGVIDILQK